MCKRLSKVYEKRLGDKPTTQVQVKKTVLAVPTKAKLAVKEEEVTADESEDVSDLSLALEKMARLGQETNINAVLNSGVDATTSLLAGD